MASTPRLRMPFLSVGAANKETTHNEALATLDVLVSGSIEGPPLSSPPASPLVGSAFIVASGATGEWAGKPDHIASWTDGGWRFVAPVDGLQMFVRGTDTWAVYRSGAWEIGVLRGSSVLIDDLQVIGPRAAAISSPTGGTVVDGPARAAIDAILAALQGHGLIA